MKGLIVIGLLALLVTGVGASETVTFDTLDFRNVTLSLDVNGDLDVRVAYDVFNSTTNQVLNRGTFDITKNLPPNTVTNLTTLYNAIKNSIVTREGL